MRVDIMEKNIPQEKMRGYTREDIKCWGCQAPFCGHRIMSLVDGKALPVCSLRECSREVLGMVDAGLLEHDYSGDELLGYSKRDLACTRCRGRHCGNVATRVVEGRVMRVCLLKTSVQEVFGADGAGRYRDETQYRIQTRENAFAR